VSFIRTGFREIALKVKRQRTRMALRHERRLLQKSEINLGREGTAQAASFPELRNEIVALKKLELEQKEVALRIAQIEEGIKKIEEERQQTAREQTEAIAKLEAEKRPLLHQRTQAKNNVDVCERELAAVERRIQESEAADRDLLKQISDLHALNPAPADLEARSASINARRARLPDERAELVRARLGSADAVRLAKEKLNAVEAELSTVEKNTARTRSEFEARDKRLNDNIRAQQEALREARTRHQTVEERKNPAYLSIGRHLAEKGVAPPNAPHLLAEAHRRREAVESHLRHKEELALLSSQIDKQELRKFYFSIFSVLVPLALILLVVFQSPRGREWLPQETDTILSINADQFERANLAKRWRSDEPMLWLGLIGPAASVPGLNVSRDAVRITRALTTNEAGETREFNLVETRRGRVSNVVRAIGDDKTFQKRTISGLPVWERQPPFAVARVGPTTLAVGAPAEVEELVLVRLGMKPDLKITGQLFDRFQALDRDSALRLISRDPPDLARVFHPIFTRELLDVSELLGLAVNLQNPVKARVLIKVNSSKSAADLARNLHDNPQQWLRLPDSQLLLFAYPPEIQSHDSSNLELRFAVPEESARLLLERLAKTDTPQAVAAY
jgi:predicted  nucleic acid-binding Zn-ribbon protein